MFREDDLLPISALQHLVFCERQAALIHVERLWADDARTVEGHHLHERTDSGGRETRGEVRIARHLPLRSLRLGLAGIADVVEFHRLPDGAGTGAFLPGLAGRWGPFPVEYKRGRPKRHRADEIQLCAQALCLEEMLGAAIERGALFYGTTRRRLDVVLDAELRSATADAAARFRAIVASGRTPKARYEKKCDSCSLLRLCRPELLSRRTARYVAALFVPAALENETP